MKVGLRRSICITRETKGSEEVSDRSDRGGEARDEYYEEPAGMFPSVPTGESYTIIT